VLWRLRQFALSKIVYSVSDSRCSTGDAVRMRRIFLFSSVTLVVLAILLISGLLPSHKPEALASTEFARELVVDLDTYENVDYGFSIAIPAGWSPVVADIEEVETPLEPGYAIGFESSRQGENDRFADYILVELLPGHDSGLFETDGSGRELITVNGRTGFREQLTIDGREDGLSAIDLIVHQAEVRGLGYTIGFFAIGEPINEIMMRDAFDVMLRTFRLKNSPFTVS